MARERGTLNDPILERIANQDPQDFERCMLALAQLGGNAAVGLTHFSGLTTEVMKELADHSNADVRAGVAAHPSCPEVLQRKLALDPDAGVRRSLAANEAAGPDLLIALASDSDEWVRLEVGRNPRSSDEAMAAFVLSSSPDEVKRAREGFPHLSDEENPGLSDQQLREFAKDAIAGPDGLRRRSALAGNPSLPEDVAAQLLDVASHRWEWRSLWGRGLMTNYQMGSVWPSTHAFLNGMAPEWLVALLAKHGHPAALLHASVSVEPPIVEPWLALRDLVNSELLIRALWRELALAGRVDLVYWNDTVEGDHFFATAPELVLMEGNTAAEFLIGGYSSDREWIETQDSLTVSGVLRRASGLFEDWFDGDLADFSQFSLDSFALSGAAWAEDLNQTPIRWTDAGQVAVEDQLWNFISDFADADDYDTVVTVRESRLPAIGYATTSDTQKAWLTELIRQSRSNAMVAKWGLAEHFLMCIALHPATPPSIRDALLLDSSHRVREAAQKTSNR